MRLPNLRLPNRFFFVGLLVGLVIAAGAVLAFPFSASRVLSYALRLHGWERVGLPVPSFPEGPPVGLLNQRLHRLDGSETSLADFEEKILFVNYWATWCAPCVEEMPAIEGLAKHFRDADVAFLLISEEPADTVREFVEEHGVAVPVYTMSETDGALSVGSIPATFIFDETRQVVFNRVGAAQWDDESSIGFLENLLADGASEPDLPGQEDAPWRRPGASRG